MGIFDIFTQKESLAPRRILELVVFSLGCETDLYRLSRRLGRVFGNPAWERFSGRRSLCFILDEGSLAGEVPYKILVRMFADGGGLLELDVDVSGHSLDVDTGLLWRRRELSSALARFMEAVFDTSDLEALRHAAGADEELLELGIVPERIAGELDFGFSPGSTLVKIGAVPSDGDKLCPQPEMVLKRGAYHLADDRAVAELECWAYREGTSSWHRLSLRRWLERMEEVRSSPDRNHLGDFARFLRRVNRFLMRERRFKAAYLPLPYLETDSEFTLLVEDFEPTSRRLQDMFSLRQEEAVQKALSQLGGFSRKQEKLFVAWVVLVAVAGIFLGVLHLFFPQASWLWIIGAGLMILFPLGAYYLWGGLRGRRESGKGKKIKELEARYRGLKEEVLTLEEDKGVPGEFREELLTRARRELARLERTIAELNSNRE